jgi:hypothetical protein
VVGNTDELVWRPGEHQHQLERAPALAALLALLFDAYAPDTRERLGDAPEGRSEYPSPGGRGAQDGVPTHMVHHRRDRC